MRGIDQLRRLQQSEEKERSGKLQSRMKTKRWIDRLWRCEKARAAGRVVRLVTKAHSDRGWEFCGRGDTAG